MDMSWDEYYYETTGYEIRYEKQLDMLRNAMYAIFAAAGGKVKPHQIFHLPFIDERTKPADRVKKLDAATEKRLIKYFD